MTHNTPSPHHRPPLKTCVYSADYDNVTTTAPRPIGENEIISPLKNTSREIGQPVRLSYIFLLDLFRRVL